MIGLRLVTYMKNAKRVYMTLHSMHGRKAYFVRNCTMDDNKINICVYLFHFTCKLLKFLTRYMRLPLCLCPLWIQTEIIESVVCRNIHIPL